MNKRKPLLIRLTAAERRTLARLARENGLSLSAMACRLIREAEQPRGHLIEATDDSGWIMRLPPALADTGESEK